MSRAGQDVTAFTEPVVANGVLYVGDRELDPSVSINEVMRTFTPQSRRSARWRTAHVWSARDRRQCRKLQHEHTTQCPAGGAGRQLRAVSCYREVAVRAKDVRSSDAPPWPEYVLW